MEQSTQEARVLKPEDLYHRADPAQFEFETTASLDGTTAILGQPRAVEAIRFGIGIEQAGYNIYAMGSQGTGKLTLVRKSFEDAAAERPTPSDWCYVNDFAEAQRPNALRLPPGRGTELQQDMRRLLDDVHTALAAAFESDEYRARRQELQEELGAQQEQALEKIRQDARERGIALMRTPAGLTFAPLKDGEVISPEELQSMSEEERQRLEESIEQLQKELQAIVMQQPRVQREIRERVTALNEEMAGLAINSLFDELRARYADEAEIPEYLSAVQQDIVTNLQHFLPDEHGGDQDAPAVLQAIRSRQQTSFQERYYVNVIVNNGDLDGAPVIFEDNPTYENLIGRIEYMAQMGALTTDYSLIKAGSLHRANGGYLILEARTLLLQPFAWEGLKRALRAGELKIESPRQMAGLISTLTLEPEPIPLDVKIALIGDRQLYYLLEGMDPEFGELFRVVADFDEIMERDAEGHQAYARLIAYYARQNGLRPFDQQAVARIIERSSRLVGDAERLSTRVRQVADLANEANYWAGEAGHDVVQAEDVQRAIDAQIYRLDRVRERAQETILRETVLIDTTGEAVGQINALTVMQLGDLAFGRPTRITASVRLGAGSVVDIEREVELSGPIHSKGVLILQGFIGQRYGTEEPLSFAANLVFEQSYGGVEGDSASLAETCALLSALSRVPIKQSLAVTGSVNQHGQVQAIGGVNEKIEGFFDVCRARGLTGEQGVLIPAANIKHLMLRQDVVDAVAEGQFHLYAVQTIDQALELLTGMPAGQPDDEGNYPPDTVNGRVQARLEQLAARRAQYQGSLNGRGDLARAGGDE